MSEEIFFLVQGSEQEPYRVTFSRKGNNLTARCSCRAGQVGQYCKHRFSIMQGIADNVVSNNSEMVERIPQMVAGTDVHAAVSALADAETAVELAKKELSRRKKALARTMMD